MALLVAGGGELLVAAGNVSARSERTGGTTALSATPTVLETVVQQMSPGVWKSLPVEAPAEGWWDFLRTNNGNVMEFASSGVWDPNSRRVLLFGSGHQARDQLIYYDERANAFRTGPTPARDVAGHAYDLNTIDPEAGILYYTGKGGAFFAYNIRDNAWTELPERLRQERYQTLAFFPGLGVLHFSGKWGDVQIYQDGQWSWIARNVYKRAGLTGFYHTLSEYNPRHHVLVFGGGNNFRPGLATKKLWLMDEHKNIRPLSDAPVGLRIAGNGSTGGLFTYEPAHGVFVHLNQNGTMWEFDVANDAWSKLSVELPEAIANDSGGATVNMFAAPISTHQVIFYMKNRSPTSTGIWVYKHERP